MEEVATGKLIDSAFWKLLKRKKELLRLANFARALFSLGSKAKCLEAICLNSSTVFEKKPSLET